MTRDPLVFSPGEFRDGLRALFGLAPWSGEVGDSVALECEINGLRYAYMAAPAHTRRVMSDELRRDLRESRAHV